MKEKKALKMSKINLKVKNEITASGSFKEASREELRVLIALMELADRRISYAELAERASVSAARARAAVALWQAEGVLTECDTSNAEDNVTDEFEERFSSSMHEQTAEESARLVRDGELESLIEECAALMDKPALTTEEVKKITSIYGQLSLSVEFIFTLAAHLAEQGRLTVTRLAKEAERLVDRGVDTIEALGIYIEDTESEGDSEKELRRVFGIWNRKLSKTEREYFRRWTVDFGFSPEIIDEAYSVMTESRSGSGISLPYIDKILSAWHAQGCTTVAMCRAASEAHKGEQAKKKSERDSGKKAEKKPKFVDFDVDEVFKRALERSYGSDGEDGSQNENDN